MNRSSKIKVTLMALAMLMLVFAPRLSYAQAGEGANLIKRARTRVTLSSQFSNALTELNVRLGALAPANLEGQTLSFTAAAGVLDIRAANSEIMHRGGLMLNNGEQNVQLRNFVINTGDDAVNQKLVGTLSAVVIVNDRFVGRLPIFQLKVTAISLAANGKFVFDNFELRLTDEAVSLLNQTFNSNNANNDINCELNIGSLLINGRTERESANGN